MRWLRREERRLTDAMAVPDWSVVHAKVTRHAVIAALFQRRYQENVLPKQQDFAGLVTAQYIQAFVTEEAENRRHGVISLNVSVGPERPRAPAGGFTRVQLHTGNQRRYTLSAKDVDQNDVPVTDASAESDNPDMVSVTQNPDNPAEFVVADNPSTGVGSATVTFRTGELEALEIVEVIAGDAVAVSVTAGDEEPREG